VIQARRQLPGSGSAPVTEMLDSGICIDNGIAAWQRQVGNEIELLWDQGAAIYLTQDFLCWAQVLMRCGSGVAVGFESDIVIL
jgi:hypothetical protein